MAEDYTVNHKDGITALWVQAAVLANDLQIVERQICRRCKQTAFYALQELSLIFYDCSCKRLGDRPVTWAMCAALITHQATMSDLHALGLKFGIDVKDKQWKQSIADKLGASKNRLDQLNEENRLLTSIEAIFLGFPVSPSVVASNNGEKVWYTV